ncbi:hypothetical protein [Mucilaginibacter glaciei]|uniref:Uncharacterized protein n=1 Tax=Mucilaginibacter glaciei TaxID=2772109 RepID=A0A926NUJ7_9SPHI|nr:hypothetical protein [Mucilaginibacter glaciei]MBD1394275.1 hypothetical protein [Mucilaginibacter glaciei]
MAYNNKNHLKHVAHVLSVYKELKEADIPDTRIVKKRLPERNIHISYRTLMYYKGMKPSELNPEQLNLFAQAV